MVALKSAFDHRFRWRIFQSRVLRKQRLTFPSSSMSLATTSALRSQSVDATGSVGAAAESTNAAAPMFCSDAVIANQSRENTGYGPSERMWRLSDAVRTAASERSFSTSSSPEA
eukprot:Amastigsp_a844695_30.p4 type:complete len:114 gc:universal Amastigsp_a844695_30:632-973(+)